MKGENDGESKALNILLSTHPPFPYLIYVFPIYFPFEF